MMHSPSTVILANALIAHSNTELLLLWLLITSEIIPITPAAASLLLSDGTTQIQLKSLDGLIGVVV